MIVYLHEVLYDDGRIKEVQVVAPDREFPLLHAPTRRHAESWAKRRGHEVVAVQPQLPKDE